MSKKKADYIAIQVFLVFLILVLLAAIPFLAQSRDAYFLSMTIPLNVGLVASLVINFVLLIKISRLKRELNPELYAEPKKKKKPAKRRQQSAPSSVVSPDKLPDPGLVFRFSLPEGHKHRRITIGRDSGTIKTYSTELLNDHISLELRMREDPDRDIYNTESEIVQKYSLDLRRNGKSLLLLPGQSEYQEMSSRQRLLIQEEEDPEGDPNFSVIEPRQPVRLQLGERLRHDGKFADGYFEFHIFTQPKKTEAGNYTRIDQDFYIRLYRIFPGYDTARPTEDGLYPMIDPYTATG